MSIDYEQLKLFVKEAMFTGGGINAASAPEGIPHRMPSADTWDKQQDMGDPKANELYDVALVAREATEQLVEALDDPFFDNAYEHAFKASASLRRVLNSLENTGAHPMPIQRVVAPPKNQQKYSSYTPNSAAVSVDPSFGGVQEQGNTPLSKVRTMSATAQAQEKRGSAQNIAGGDELAGIDGRERGMLQDIEKILTDIADKDDILLYRPFFQNFLKNLLKKVDNKLKTQSPQGGTETPLS